MSNIHQATYHLVRLPELGGYLRAIREYEGISQAELARRVGRERTTITNIESGRFNTTLETLADIAGAMEYVVEVRFVKRVY